MVRPLAVATDLDGTLVRSDGTVSDRSRAALRLAETHGAVVILVTGRPPRWMPSTAEQTGTSGLAVCANGAAIFDLGRGEIITETRLDPAVAGRLVADISAALPDVVFAVERGMEFGREPGYVSTSTLSPALVAPAPDLVAEPVTKLLVRVPGRTSTELQSVIASIAGADAVVTYSGEALLEVAAPGCSKAAALAGLCALRDIPPERVVALGDQANHLPMFAWAGHPVAVANAHPSVLAAAAAVTSSNDEDGVARVLERVFHGAAQR